LVPDRQKLVLCIRNHHEGSMNVRGWGGTSRIAGKGLFAAPPMKMNNPLQGEGAFKERSSRSASTRRRCCWDALGETLHCDDTTPLQPALRGEEYRDGEYPHPE
jgi:hypothetical protein